MQLLCQLNSGLDWGIYLNGKYTNKNFIFSMSHLLNLAHYTVTLILAQRKAKKKKRQNQLPGTAYTNTAARKKSQDRCVEKQTFQLQFTASVLDMMQSPCAQKSAHFLPSYQNGLVKNLTIPWPFKEKLTFEYKNSFSRNHSCIFLKIVHLIPQPAFTPTLKANEQRIPGI